MGYDGIKPVLRNRSSLSTSMKGVWPQVASSKVGGGPKKKFY